MPRFLTIFLLLGEGGGGILQLKSQSAKISGNCHFRGGGAGGYSVLQNRGKLEFWTKFSTTPAGSCITDSLSHTTYVETKNATVINVLIQV